MKGPFTATVQIAGPFKIDTDSVKIETTFAESGSPAKSNNWQWVLGIVVVIAGIAVVVRRK